MTALNPQQNAALHEHMRQHLARNGISYPPLHRDAETLTQHHFGPEGLTKPSVAPTGSKTMLYPALLTVEYEEIPASPTELATWAKSKGGYPISSHRAWPPGLPAARDIRAGLS